MTGTTADTWPDGTPKRSAVTRALWNGERPQVEPIKTTLAMGDSVAFKEPVDDNGNPTIRGVVLWVDVDYETGEQTVAIARQMPRRADRRYSDIKWDYRLERHPAEMVDPAWHLPSTQYDRGRAWMVAGQIAIAVGARHAFGTGTRWSRDDLLLIGGVLQLAELGGGDEYMRDEAS